jgi:hypothetical protein
VWDWSEVKYAEMKNLGVEHRTEDVGWKQLLYP